MSVQRTGEVHTQPGESAVATAEPPPPRVSVVVVTYSPGESLQAFLDSLQLATGEPVQVVLADNGSHDGSVRAAAERAGVEVIRNPENLGYGRAANVGVARTTSEYVVVANPDVVWEPGALDDLLAAAERWPHGGAFGPLIRRPDGAIYPSARALPSLSAGIGHALLGWVWPGNPWTVAYRLEVTAPAERTAGWLSGSCLLLRRQAFDEVGGFNPSYFMYFEDLDLGERLSQHGWANVYVPTAVVTHVGGHATTHDGANMVREHHRSAWHYLSGRYAGWRWLPLRLALRAGLTLRARLAVRVDRLAKGAGPQRFE